MIVVVADDITGAAEIAGICLRYNQIVIFSIDNIPADLADILVIATNTRSLTETEAGKIHAKLAKQIRLLNPEFVFKKCDSVLRGHIQVETNELAGVFEMTEINLQPSNPNSGRVIRNQVYYIHNELIENTDFAGDPDFPALTSGISTLLNRNQKKFKTRIMVDDCDSVESLREIANRNKNEKVLAGSSVFFEQLLISKYGFAEKKPDKTDFNCSDFVVLNGSMHPSGLLSVNHLKDKYQLVTIPSDLYSQEIKQDSIRAFADFLVNQYLFNKGIFIFLDPDIGKITRDQHFILERTLSIIQLLFQEKTVKQYFITGGATAYSILQFFGWNSLIPEQELSPGVICFSLSTQNDRKISIKPGSYSWGIQF
jgi:uncharacterized protein YgbK (DUF1537 family)